MDTLAVGSRGQEVINLQEALNYQLPQAAPALKVDGSFGPKTAARLQAFQSLRGLKPDGIAGPKSHAALYSFVRGRAHLLVPPARSTARSLTTSDGDVGPVPDFRPVPNLILPFPDPFRRPPPHVFPLPPLTLGTTTPFELSAGVQRTFSRSLTSNSPERTTSIFSDLTFSAWRRPVGRFVDVAFGPGAFFEREVQETPKSSLRVGVFAKAELHNLVNLGPLDLFKLIVEHKTVTTVNGPIELTSDVEVGFNPTVEVTVDGTKLEFGPKFSKFLEIGFLRDGFSVKSGTTVTTGSLTVFF